MSGPSLQETRRCSNTVLFVDDDINILHALERLFRDRDMTLLFADHPGKALDLVEKEEIAVLVSDNLMPGMTGIELLSQITALSPDTVKILMTAYADLETAINAINKGEIFRFITKPWENTALVAAVDEAMWRYSMVRSIRTSDEAHLLSLAQTIELKDPYTRGHCDRVADFALAISDVLLLHEDYKRDIRYGSWLHDCGKIGVPENILNKPGSLIPEEMDVVRKHPVWGAEVARLSRQSDTIVNIIYLHHERFDGTGYPTRKKGKDIPLEARIVTVADIFDALTSDRPYRKANDLYTSLNILKSMRGRELDPELLDIFLDIMGRTEL